MNQTIEDRNGMTYVATGGREPVLVSAMGNMHLLDGYTQAVQNRAYYVHNGPTVGHSDEEGDLLKVETALYNELIRRLA